MLEKSGSIRFAFLVSLIAAAGLGFIEVAFASERAVQRVTMEVESVGVLSVSGNPSPLVVAIAVDRTGSGRGNFAQDQSTYIQYSAAVSRRQHLTVTAQWSSSESAPAGCSLRLQAFPAGRKNEGRSAGQITLSSAPQPILLDIGSCSTGAGPALGAQLGYTLSIDSANDVVVGEIRSATIIFTLGDRG